MLLGYHPRTQAVRQRVNLKISKRKTNSARSPSSVSRKNDGVCLLILCTFVVLYFIVLYFFFRGDIRITKAKLPAVLHDTIPFSYNFTKQQFDAHFVSWLMNPDSLCWNLDAVTESTVFVVTVMVHYNNVSRLYIRQNRMVYAKINGYVYCEYSDLSRHLTTANMIGLLDNASDLSTNDNRYERWYKLFFLKYLMNEKRYSTKMGYVLWMDFDSVVINFHYSVGVMLNIYGNEHSLYAERDPFAILNSGVFLLRNDEWSRGLLDYCTSDHIVQNAFLESPFRDQWALLQYSKEFPEEWKSHILLIEGLQMLHSNNDFRKYQYPTLTWHIDGSKTRQMVLIECVLLKYQPLWFLLVAHNETNRELLNEQCENQLSHEF